MRAAGISITHIVWPDTNEPMVVETFADALVNCVHAGLNISREGGKNAYSAVGIARKVLLFANEMNPNMFDRCSMKKISTWTADEAGHVQVLEQLNGVQVREAFGMPPIMISCWTCYLGCCHNDASKALQTASDERLLEVLATLKKDGNHFPGPHTVAKVLIGRSALKGPELGLNFRLAASEQGS